jgi:hypothetical protein
VAGFTNAGGFASLNKGQFDSLLNQTIQALDQALTQAQAIQAIFAAHPDADFTAVNTNPGPTGYAAADVTIMKSAFGDLNQLATIYQGGATLATAKDFRTFVKQLATLYH